MDAQRSVSVHVGRRVTLIRAVPPPPPDAVAIAERTIQIALGLTSLVVESVIEAVARTIAPRQEEAPTPALGPLLAGAALGAAIETARLGASAASIGARSLQPLVSFVLSPSFIGERLQRARDRATEFDDRWRREQFEDEQAGSTFVADILPRLVDATLDRIDLTELVLARLDLDRIVDAVDLERAIARVDLNAVVARVDIEAIVRGLDLASIANEVIDQLDLTAIANEVIAQLDLAAIASDVIDEVDLPQIVRQSTGTMATETVEGVRVQGMSADRAVARLVDRLLGRDGERGRLEAGDPAGGDPAGGDPGDTA